jgi:hypothetical protein
MTIAIIALSLTVSAVVALAVIERRARLLVAERLEAVEAARNASGYERLIGRRVQTQGVRGVLTHVYTDCFVFAHPEFLGGAAPAGVVGEVVLERSEATVLQVLPQVEA